jgi:CRISPR/Cas system-associated protein Csm6
VSSDEPNFLTTAFKSQVNVISLAGFAALAAITGTLAPIAIAAGAELVLLPLISSLPYYQRIIRLKTALEREAKEKAQREAQTAEMLVYLPEAERERYRTLTRLCAEIRENYAGLDASSQVLLTELVGKLDFLLAFYLRTRWSLMRYRSYFTTTDPGKIKDRIAALDKEIADVPPRVQQIKSRTKAVLVKRLERYQKAQENRQLVEAQTETVVEVLQLLRDQSFAMTDPRTLTAQLDNLVASAEATERDVKGMEAILTLDQDSLSMDGLGQEVASELGALQAAGPEAVSSPPAPRTRVR